MKTRLLLSALFFSLNFVQAQQFVEQAAALGIDHNNEARGLMGGGVAFFDFDNDGDDDCYLTRGLSKDELYLNNGDGTFSKGGNELNLEITAQYNTTGITTGDIDNDGDRDLFLTTWERFENGNEPIARNLLFLNNNDGSFTEIGATAGITETAFSIGANFLDYNKDGFLDIYVINHVEAPAFLYDNNGVIVGFDHECYPNFFYLNNGDNTFTEVAATLGVAEAACGLAAIPSDYDFDGDLDIMTANDFGPFLTPNELFQNNYPDDSFTEIASSVGAAIPMYGMGIAAGDYDHDQDLDYYITNLGANVLLENSNSTFQNVAAAAMVENTYANANNDFSTGWGTAFMDVDNDGWEDIYVANGRIPSLSTLPTATNDPNKLYLNNGDKTFTDITDQAAVGADDYNRGMAYSDFDNDGDLDIMTIALSELGATSKLYVNQNNNGNHFIQFKLVGMESNRDGFGSKIWVYAGGEALLKESYGGGASHVSQHTSVMHFGLGSNTSIDSVRIEWTNGIQDHFGSMEIDQLHTIEEGITSSTNDKYNTGEFSFDISPNPFTDQLEISSTQFLQQKVIIELLSLTGVSILSKMVYLDEKTILSVPGNLASGIYLLAIKTNDGNAIKKVVKL